MAGVKAALNRSFLGAISIAIFPEGRGEGGSNFAPSTLPDVISGFTFNKLYKGFTFSAQSVLGAGTILCFSIFSAGRQTVGGQEVTGEKR